MAIACVFTGIGRFQSQELASDSAEQSLGEMACCMNTPLSGDPRAVAFALSSVCNGRTSSSRVRFNRPVGVLLRNTANFS